jgi:uncharacterized OsmC-like protein
MPMKRAQVVATQGNGFRTECTAGSHTVIVDQPVGGGGTDAGPSPLDYQLVALGGCITAIGRIIANQRRLDIRGITANVEGDLNLDGLLGKESTDRVGFSAIRAEVTIDADLSPDEKAALIEEIDHRCPISDNLTNGTSVEIALAG